MSGALRLLCSHTLTTTRLCPVVSGLNPSHHRTFFGWLNNIFNMVDHERIKVAGPDRACAEWLLRCGASVRWMDAEKFLKDYNSLPVGGGGGRIQAVDGTDSAIMEVGFPHFDNLAYFNELKLKNCIYISDESMGHLVARISDKVETLEMTDLKAISDGGLLVLRKMQKLKKLHLENLPEVLQPQETLTKLSNALPNCKITFPPHTNCEDEEDSK